MGPQHFLHILAFGWKVKLLCAVNQKVDQTNDLRNYAKKQNKPKRCNTYSSKSIYIFKDLPHNVRCSKTKSFLPNSQISKVSLPLRRKFSRLRLNCKCFTKNTIEKVHRIRECFHLKFFKCFSTYLYGTWALKQKEKLLHTWLCLTLRLFVLGSKCVSTVYRTACNNY